MQVALVDDHEIVTVAVQVAVEQADGLEFLGAAATVPELLDRFPHPELVLLDLRLADGSSPVANVDLLIDAGARVLVLTSGESPYLLRSVAKTPVVGIVRKSAPLATLVEALTAAAAGETSMSAEWAAAIDGDPDLPLAGLSSQEQRVLELFARGIKAQSVAYQLGIKVATVDDYVRRIRAKYEKVGRPAYTKIDLYQRAIEDGFLPGPLG
ncbi:response regulator transcription factor [Curtobacterium ammoniigenes]|uniref:response regulator transcription factor n=1 Tax=Curtobacterium ammoniigenes TaxID=395387 RepID=UPI000A8F8FD1|nr:response regulator transcription factor [Curtobacterium ammoniigenes]